MSEWKLVPVEPAPAYRLCERNAMTDEQLAALFPRRARAKRRACCSWHDFIGDFVHHWRRKSLSGQPSRREVATAILDWQAGNTGYEAVCNLLARRAENKESHD